MAGSKKTGSKKLELEAHMLYDKPDAIQILAITEQEFDKLKIRETELRPGGDIVYDFRDLWPLVYGEEYQEPGKK